MLFRVETQDPESAVMHTIYVGADSPSSAMAHVNRGGLIVRAVHRAEDNEVPPGTTIEDASPGASRRDRRADGSRLLTHPISTIALGVCLGMCLFTVVSIIVAGILR
jgi:hypothetical protein